MEFKFEVDDLRYIVYKFLDDAIDNIHPLMEVSETYYTPVSRVEPNIYNFRLDISQSSSLLLRTIEWYQRDNNSYYGWRIKFKYDKEKEILIKDSLKHTSKTSRLLLDKFQVTIIGSFYTEMIGGKEYNVADILAVRIQDIRRILKAE